MSLQRFAAAGRTVAPVPIPIVAISPVGFRATTIRRLPIRGKVSLAIEPEGGESEEAS